MSFECDGLGRARMALVELAKHPKANLKNKLARDLVKELYVEIREARIAGHGWETIKKILAGNTKICISIGSLKQLFTEIDKGYASETGVPALPTMSKKRGRPKKEKE